MSEISNGRFETVGFADWTQYPGTGTITQTNVGAEVYCGTYAAKLARGATDVTELYQRLSSPLSDRRYVLSAYTRGDGGDGAARIEIYDVTHDVAIGTYYPDNHSATYAFYRCDFAIPQGCNDIDIVLGVEIASTTAYFDDVLVTFEGYFIGGWDDGVVYGAGQAHKWMIYQAENETRLTVTKNPR
jgi:hypothetical protein